MRRKPQAISVEVSPETAAARWFFQWASVLAFIWTLALVLPGCGAFRAGPDLPEQRLPQLDPPGAAHGAWPAGFFNGAAAPGDGGSLVLASSSFRVSRPSLGGDSVSVRQSSASFVVQGGIRDAR